MHTPSPLSFDSLKSPLLKKCFSDLSLYESVRISNVIRFPDFYGDLVYKLKKIVELVDTNAYKLQPSLSERVIVDGHGCHTALHFGVKAKENQDKVPTLYLLPKLHKKPYKARFIANSSSCTTTALSKLLTSCLTAVKNMLSNIVKRYMRDPVKTYFGLLKIQVKF